MLGLSFSRFWCCLFPTNHKTIDNSIIFPANGIIFAFFKAISGTYTHCLDCFISEEYSKFTFHNSNELSQKLGPSIPEKLLLNSFLINHYQIQFQHRKLFLYAKVHVRYYGHNLLKCSPDQQVHIFTFILI